MTTVATTSPIEYLAEVRKFLTENASLQSMQMTEYNINVTTDWLHSICAVYCDLDAASITKNCDINTSSDFDLDNQDHISEIQKYAYQFGTDSKYWTGTGCYTFPNFTQVSVLDQIQSSLNMFLIHVFLKDTAYKIKKSVVSSELQHVNSVDDIDSISTRILSKVAQFINVENTKDILVQLIQFGVFDKKVQTDFVYNGDKLTFPIHLKIKGDVTEQESVTYVLNLNLIQQCSVTRSFRVWIHSLWDQITLMNDRISNLKCVIQCKSVECSTELDALNAEIASLLQQLESKTLTISSLEAQLQSNITTVSSSVESLSHKIKTLQNEREEKQTEIQSLQNTSSTVAANRKNHSYVALLQAIRGRIYPDGVASGSVVDEKNTEIKKIDEQLSRWNVKLEKAEEEKNRINIDLKTVQHQLECTQMSLDEIKQKSERLSMKSQIIQQQQESVVLQQNSLKVLWSNQNATIMHMCQEMDKCSNKMDNFYAERNIEDKQLKENNDRIDKLKQKIGIFRQSKSESDEDQLQLLGQLQYIANEASSLELENYEFQSQMRGLIAEIEVKKKEKETLLNDEHSTRVDTQEIQHEVQQLKIRKQKLQHECVMMDLVVQIKLVSFLDDKTNVAAELNEWNEYDKMIYDAIDILVRRLEVSEHKRIEIIQRTTNLEKKIESMQTVIITLKSQIKELKNSKRELLERINTLKDHLDESIVEKSSHRKEIDFLKNQIDLLQLYNKQLIRHQKIYDSHIADIQTATQESDLHAIDPSSQAIYNVQKERLQYLTHLEKLSSILAVCKSNYGMYRNLFDMYKLTEILKLCKKLIAIKLRVDKINRTKHFGVGSDGKMTKMNATLDLTKFMKASTPVDNSLLILKKYFQRYFDRWRFLKFKDDGVNRFPRPTENELMRFAFQMTLYRIKKQKMEEKEEE